MIRRICQALAVAVGLSSFLLAEALEPGTQTDGLVRALLPSDDDLMTFLADPENSFPIVEADGEWADHGEDDCA